MRTIKIVIFIGAWDRTLHLNHPIHINLPKYAELNNFIINISGKKNRQGCALPREQ